MAREALHNPSPQCGFSLLEVLTAVVIIGIATSLAGVSLGAIGTARRDLHQDAQRLAQLFPLAQAEARSRGLPIVWEYDASGYRFRALPRVLMLPWDRAQDDDFATHAVSHHALRTRAWQTDGAVRVRITPDGAHVFDGEWMPAPMTIELRDAHTSVTIARHADGRYAVRPAQ